MIALTEGKKVDGLPAFRYDRESRLIQVGSEGELENVYRYRCDEYGFRPVPHCEASICEMIAGKPIAEIERLIRADLVRLSEALSTLPPVKGTTPLEA